MSEAKRQFNNDAIPHEMSEVTKRRIEMLSDLERQLQAGERSDKQYNKSLGYLRHKHKKYK